jgi:hypothetical protein
MADDTTSATKRICELEDELKIAERRIVELRAERDEANELVGSMRERRIVPGVIGRPLSASEAQKLAASEAQIAQLLKLYSNPAD